MHILHTCLFVCDMPPLVEPGTTEAHRLSMEEMVRDPCNLYTKEPFPQSHAGEQYTVSSRRSLSLSLSQHEGLAWPVVCIADLHRNFTVQLCDDKGDVSCTGNLEEALARTQTFKPGAPETPQLHLSRANIPSTVLQIPVMLPLSFDWFPELSAPPVLPQKVQSQSSPLGMFMAQLMAGRNAPAAYELVAAAAALGTFGSLMPSSGQHTAAAAVNITAPLNAAAAANSPSSSTAAAEGTPASRGSPPISAAIAPPAAAAAAAVLPNVASRLGGNLDKAALLAFAKHLVTIVVSDDPSELATLAESTTQHLPGFRAPAAAPAAPAVDAATPPAAALTSSRKRVGSGGVTCFGSRSSLLFTQALEALTGEGPHHCSTGSSSPSGSDSGLEFSPQSDQHHGSSTAQNMYMEEERFQQKLDKGLQEAAAAPFAWKRKHTLGLNTAAQQYVQEDQTPSSKRVRPGTDKGGHFRADQQQCTQDLALPGGLAQGVAYAPPALQSEADRSWPAPALAPLPGCSFRGASDSMPAAGCSSRTTSRDPRAAWGRYSEGERQQQEEDAMEDEVVYPAACPAVASHPRSYVDGPRELQVGGEAASKENSAMASSVARALLEAVGLLPPPREAEKQQQRREQQEVAARQQPASSHLMQDTEEDEQQRWMRWGRMPQQPLQGAPGCKSQVFKVRQHLPAGHAAAEQSSSPTLFSRKKAGVLLQLYRPQRHAKASSPPWHYKQQQHAPQLSMFHQPVLAAGPSARSSAAAAHPPCPALPAALQQHIKQRQQHFQQQRQQSSTHQTQSDGVNEQQQSQLEQHQHYCQQQNHQKQQHPHQQQPPPQLDLQSLLAQVEQDAVELSGHPPATQQLLLEVGQMAHWLGSPRGARHPAAGTLPPSY